MAFVDEVYIYARAGNGGDGVVRWLAEKGKPKGGPAGGNGGRGGNVFAEAVSDLGYLANYRHTKSFAAEDGQDGMKHNKEGRGGEPLVLKFPVGTVIRNTDTGEIIELMVPGEQHLLLKGGQGGLGNTHFKSSRNVTPRQSTPGKPGERANFHIELKLVADIGLVGFPNAGKSSLINAITNAKSQIGAYPFTTLEPHLGSFYGYVIADIPGLIEGASEGKGLGDKFLRHISRTRVLMHLVSAETEDVKERYISIRDELSRYSEALAEKREIIVLTKVDLVDHETRQKYVDLLKKEGDEVWVLSVEDEKLVKEFSAKLSKLLEEERASMAAQNEDE